MIADRPADWARIIRERRMALNMSQADLAVELGTSRQWLSNFENGRSTDAAQLHVVLQLIALLDLTAVLTAETE
ncbi:helix-turn-helix transcriptional regulator [Cryobacterium sp. HLT2-28]|uniref:helix-turn-helix transcriptional regulator n=1 Tax=Cryobacterium sp. HLT2-28 TaxID=1259146 RepID=UPI00106C5675|nr:helix-turn-helix transcriptional regulator [Cryobacterium sp. HLT2-28]TFB93192.1 XRE family transcriptional regulator [Cryobacterium sp. HLT2-28]